MVKGEKFQKVLIIGSGIGGLSCAIILAKLGFAVTVLEKNHQAGGLVRSYMRDDIACEVGVHYLGSLDKGQVLRTFFDYLGVTDSIPLIRMGREGVIDRYLFDQPETHPLFFDLPEGFDALENNLFEHFPGDFRCIQAVMETVRASAKQLHNLDILFAEGDDFALLDYGEPCGEILDRIGCSPGLRTIMSMPSSWIGVPLDECPASYHGMALASYVSSSWRLQNSGAAMADVFVSRLQELGGQVITRAEVSEIRVDCRKVVGVELISGQQIDADIIIGAVHPGVVLDMLPEGAVKPSYRNRIRRLKNTHSVFMVHAAVDDSVRPPIPHNLFKVQAEKNGNVLDLSYYQVRKSGRDGCSLLSILTSGHEELWQPWINTRTGRRGPEYVAAKQALAEKVIDESRSVLGELTGVQLLDAATPLTFRDWLASPDGSAYGVLRSSSQMLGAAMLNRTSIRGLSLAGQNVMAPGVIGTIMGSFSTVKVILGADEFVKQVRL